MRFKCNLRPDPLEGQEPCPDDWEGFFKVQGGVSYRIPIHYDADERMWHMYYGVGVSPSDAVKDGKLNHRTQQVDLTDDDQAEYDRHAADVCIVTRHAQANYTSDTVTPNAEGGSHPATHTTPTASRVALSGTTADMEPEPEAEEPLPRHVEIRDGQHATQEDDTGVVELDQDVEWNQIQPHVRPTQRAQSRKLNELERHRRLGHMGKCPRGGCAICQQTRPPPRSLE